MNLILSSDKVTTHFANMQENKSQNAISVISRLKKALKIKTDIELSEFLNIKPNTISTWKKRDSVDFDSIITICELYELDLNEIFLNKKKAGAYTNHTPLISREVQFQYAKGNDNASLLDILPKYSFPFISADESRVFQVVSNNMFPVIDENSFVVCEKIDIDRIENDSIIVFVSHEKGLFINRVAKSTYDDNIFVLSNENDFYSSSKLNVSEISEAWVVRGVLSYDINNANRFKFINESIKKINKFLDDAKDK